MKKEIVCTVCPVGCMITVEGDGGEITSIEGYTCERGKEYAKSEFVAPKRMLATSVKAKGYKTPIVSVRSNGMIPIEKIAECMDVIRSIEVEEPFEIGRVVVPDILDTGVDIILTNC